MYTNENPLEKNNFPITSHSPTHSNIEMKISFLYEKKEKFFSAKHKKISMSLHVKIFLYKKWKLT